MGSGGSRPAGRGSGRPRSVDRTSYYSTHAGLHNSHNDGTESDITRRPRPYSEATDELLKVSNVDLDVRNNTRDHHTDEFDVVEKRQELILRRGQHFNISVEFNRAYDPQKDDLKLVFHFGSSPRRSNGTHAEFVLSDRDTQNEWGASIKSNQGNVLSLRVTSTSICAVGKWSLKIDVVKRTDRNASVYRYTHPAPIYFLFNPWCKDDHVYMKEEKLLEEYIMKESGKIYAGDGVRISPKPWAFSQFNGKVFDCVMYLLDKSGLPDYERGYPVMVARKMSSVVNSPDDGGVLVGNWRGEYSGGTSPLEWTGSAAILTEFLDTKRPVKFGQCWVFSGVLTSVCRALGLPARSVTNFQSAHDTDGSITIDKHFDHKGDPLERKDRDSVWNFHVWNDVWMARPDLPPGYGGWQAVDATPQETSEGIHQMGPASLLALKRGEVYFQFDGRFAFGEVNADMVYWMENADDSLTVIDVKTKRVGVKMSTKQVLGDDREDVTNQYKFEEGTDEERAAVHCANVHSTMKAEEIYKPIATDVEFSLVSNPDTFMGDTAKFGLDVRNNSSERRTVWGNITFSSTYYTGVTHKKIKRHEIDYTVLEAKEAKLIEVEVDVNEYLEKLTDHCICMISCMCIVQETRQTYANTKELRFRKPHLKIEAPKTGKVGEKFEVEVSFDNPLPVTLTECHLRVEGPGIQEPDIYKQSNVNPKQTYTGKFEMCPVKPGAREIIVYFNCKQILSVNISHHITIKK